MLTVCSLLLCLAAPDSAEATFKKIEDVLAKADTPKITVRSTAKTGAGEHKKNAEAETTLLFKGPDKLRVTASIDEGKTSPQVIRFVANGAKMRDADGDIKATPAGFRTRLLGGFCRLGGFAVAHGAVPPDEPMPVASNFKVAEEKGESAPTFDLAFDGSTWKSALVFDPKTHRILKADIRLIPTDPKSEGKAGKSVTVTETIKIETNVDIPARDFDLGAERPAK